MTKKPYRYRFRPDVDPLLQRPLQIIATLENRDIKTVTTIALAAYIENSLDEEICRRNSARSKNPSDSYDQYIIEILEKWQKEIDKLTNAIHEGFEK